MTTLQIQLNDGEVVYVRVSTHLLPTMLTISPGFTGIHFRQDLTFSVLLESGRRATVSPCRIQLAA